MKARNGATPVPEPTIIIGLVVSFGRRKLSLCSTNTRTAPSSSTRSAKKLEAAPLRALPSCSKRTTPTVRCTSSPTSAGEDEMEYKRGVKGRNNETSCSAVNFAGNLCNTSTIGVR